MRLKTAIKKCKPYNEDWPDKIKSEQEFLLIFFLNVFQPQLMRSILRPFDSKDEWGQAGTNLASERNCLTFLPGEGLSVKNLLHPHNISLSV